MPLVNTPKGNATASETPAKAPIGIIAFDFDGTITTKDTFALFLRYWAGTPRWALKITALLPVFIMYGLKIIDRNAVKAHVVRRFFKNADAKALENRAKRFAREIIPQYVRPEALKTLRDHIRESNTVYIVSASITPYLIAWADMHGAPPVIATNLFMVNGRLTGEIEGPNCWGQGKIDKLNIYFKDIDFYIVEAFGDSRGDQEMLHAADVSHWRPFRL